MIKNHKAYMRHMVKYYDFLMKKYILAGNRVRRRDILIKTREEICEDMVLTHIHIIPAAVKFYTKNTTLTCIKKDEGYYLNFESGGQIFNEFVYNGQFFIKI